MPRTRRGRSSLTNREGRQSNRERMRRNRNRNDESEDEDNNQQPDQQPIERPGTRRRNVRIVTDDDYARIFENAQHSIEMQACNTCNEQFFDIGVVNDVCSPCRKSTERGTFNLFTAANGMDPGIFHSHIFLIFP